MAVDIEEIDAVMHHGRGIRRLRIPCSEAEFAMDLMRRWGTAAVPDGEDSRGNARFRPMTEQELVEKATETAALAFLAFEAEGWMLHLEPEASDDE